MSGDTLNGINWQVDWPERERESEREREREGAKQGGTLERANPAKGENDEQPTRETDEREKESSRPMGDDGAVFLFCDCDGAAPHPRTR